VERIAGGFPLNPYDRSTFYGGDERGYTDYKSYQALEIAGVNGQLAEQPSLRGADAARHV
jgi:hypothetical protein